MQCLMKMSMMACAGLSLSSCALFQELKPPVTDSFCQIYNKVVVEKGDSEITAKTSVKKRILANELTYKDQCLSK